MNQSKSIRQEELFRSTERFGRTLKLVNDLLDHYHQDLLPVERALLDRWCGNLPTMGLDIFLTGLAEEIGVISNQTDAEIVYRQTVASCDLTKEE